VEGVIESSASVLRNGKNVTVRLQPMEVLLIGLQ
jgi:hypothetical protein